MDINITNPVTAAKIGEVVNGSASATPNDTDLIMSVDTSVAKKNTWTQIKAFLKTYFDTLYATAASIVYCVTLFNINNLSVVDSGTYYLGTSSAFGTTTNQIAFMPLDAGILRRVAIEVYSASTIGSSEDGTLTLYYNNGAASVVLTTAFKVDANRHSCLNLTGFSTAISNGNAYVEYAAPVLATNPIAIQVRVNLFIQPT